MLLRNLQTIDINEEILSLDSYNLQKRMAEKLRAAAIQHLRAGQGVVAKGFRGEYHAIKNDSYESFLRIQARDGEWGTYIEATALAEKLDFTLVVTPVKKGVEQKPICLYRATNNQAPVIELYNSDNNHWFVNSNTLGDGNCLYNSMAQGFQKSVKPQTTRRVEASQSRMFPSVDENQKTIQRQQEIFAAIQAKPTAAEEARELEKESRRVASLPESERAQIQRDYLYALQVAREDSAVNSFRL